nr:hypothetical protein [uncultured Steroidobacter sp.]
MTTGRRVAIRGLCLAGLGLWLLPGISAAREFLPAPSWLESVKAPAPVIGYRLGMVACEAGAECSPCGQPSAEYLTDVRAALRDVNLFDRSSPSRMSVAVQIKQQSSGYNDRNVGTCNAAITYRFRDGERTVYEYTLNVSALMDAFTDATVKAVLTASVKSLVLKLRREHGDAAFLARVGTLEQAVDRDLVNHSRSIGGVMAQGFVSTVEGTIGVVQGVAEVGMGMVEVAASPEFQAAVQESLVEQQAERDRQDAMLRDIQRQAEDRRRVEQARAEEQQRAVAATPVMASMPSAATTVPTTAASSAEWEKAQQEEQARIRAAAEERERRQKVEAERAEQERKAKEAERVRLAEERKRQEEAARQQRQRDLENYLAAEARSIRMRAISCDGRYQATGSQPNVRPRLANCLRVSYEARCPGTPQGMGIADRINNYVGGASCYGETRELPGRLNCPVDAVIVEVTEVSLCP